MNKFVILKVGSVIDGDFLGVIHLLIKCMLPDNIMYYCSVGTLCKLKIMKFYFLISFY